MINHFKTYLCNRESVFFEDSLFRVFIEPHFQSSPENEWTRRLREVLFGKNPDATFMDYRFYQFLRLIDGCHLSEHLHRWDGRDTYFQGTYSIHDGLLFLPEIVPGSGIAISEMSERPSDFLRKQFHVLYQPAHVTPLQVYDGKDTGKVIPMISTGAMSCNIPSLGLMLTVNHAGFWRVDYRARPGRQVIDIVNSALDMPSQVFHGLFAMIRNVAPEYEDGFRTITDSLTKFCMLLFALGAATEQLQGNHDLAVKRLREADGKELPINAEGILYYGWNINGSLTITDIKRHCQSLVCNHRRQVFDMPVPELSWIYLAWPLRFGLPAHNRILVDGMLNSGWEIRHAEDTDERYVILRSLNKVRTDTPIHFEIL